MIIRNLTHRDRYTIRPHVYRDESGYTLSGPHGRMFHTDRAVLEACRNVARSLPVSHTVKGKVGLAMRELHDRSVSLVFMGKVAPEDWQSAERLALAEMVAELGEATTIDYASFNLEAIANVLRAGPVSRHRQ